MTATLDPLDALAHQAAAVDQQLDSTAPGAPHAEPVVDMGEQVQAFLQLAVALLTPALPFLPSCYTADACERIGKAFDAVAQKRGWDMGQVMSPELALFVVALPPTIQAVIAGRKHFAPPPPARPALNPGTNNLAQSADEPVVDTYAQAGIRVLPTDD